MISLKDHRTQLSNLGVTISALERLEKLIDVYAADKPGPAYVSFENTGSGKVEVQFDRKIMVTALSAQRQGLVDYLATLGITA